MNDPDKAELAASLVRVVQMHDKETAVHLEATAVLARRVAEAMGLSDEQIRNTELAALLHDVGKVGIRREILTKTAALTAEEWQEMRLHPESGAALLIDMPKLAYLAPIVRAHHERIDGYGYPDHLRADEIPIEARVIAVADAFHAMTTSRPYRKAMMPNDALAILADNAGTQFDRDVVAAMLRLFRFSVESHRAIA